MSRSRSDARLAIRCTIGVRAMLGFWGRIRPNQIVALAESRAARRGVAPRKHHAAHRADLCRVAPLSHHSTRRPVDHCARRRVGRAQVAPTTSGRQIGRANLPSIKDVLANRFELLRTREQIHHARHMPARPAGGWDLSLIQRDRDCADALGHLRPGSIGAGAAPPTLR